MTAPRGISQPPTSFIGSQCQGIHHAPLNTYNTKTKNEFQKKLHIHTQTLTHTTQTGGESPHVSACKMLATTIHKSNTTPHHQSEATTRRPPTTGKPPPHGSTGLLSQSPIVCLAVLNVCCCTGIANPLQADPLLSQPHSSHGRGGGGIKMVLLRKEVIQPHLPVRLPCYDFVPIASPTFDGSLHKGWATGFGCCRLS